LKLEEEKKAIEEAEEDELKRIKIAEAMQ